MTSRGSARRFSFLRILQNLVLVKVREGLLSGVKCGRQSLSVRVAETQELEIS